VLIRKIDNDSVGMRNGEVGELKERERGDEKLYPQHPGKGGLSSDVKKKLRN